MITKNQEHGIHRSPLTGQNVFCKHSTREKEKQLLRISTFEACNNNKQSAEAREDTDLLSILKDGAY